MAVRHQSQNAQKPAQAIENNGLQQVIRCSVKESPRPCVKPPGGIERLVSERPDGVTAEPQHVVVTVTHDSVVTIGCGRVGRLVEGPCPVEGFVEPDFRTESKLPEVDMLVDKVRPVRHAQGQFTISGGFSHIIGVGLVGQRLGEGGEAGIFQDRPTRIVAEDFATGIERQGRVDVIRKIGGHTVHIITA